MRLGVFGRDIRTPICWLLHRFGGYQVGRTFIVDRAALIAQLEAMQTSGAFDREHWRMTRILEEL